jgi:GTP-binding protein
MEGAVPWSLVFTKTDQAKPSQVQKNITLFEDRILLSGAELPGTFTTSAKLKTGRSELLTYIKEMLG